MVDAPRNSSHVARQQIRLRGMQRAPRGRSLQRQSPALRNPQPLLHSEGKVQQASDGLFGDRPSAEFSAGAPFLQNTGEFALISFSCQWNNARMRITFGRCRNTLVPQQLLDPTNLFDADLFAVGVLGLEMEIACGRVPGFPFFENTRPRISGPLAT